MKFLALIALLSANALAVQTRNCPAQLTVIYSDLKLDRTLGQIIDQDQFVNENEISKLTAAFFNVQNTRAVNRTMDMHTARNGRCIYRPTTNRATEEKIELYTKDSKDLLMIQTDIAPKGVLLRVYAPIQSLAPDRIVLKDAAPGMALAIPRGPYETYSAGGSLTFIGNVRNISADVE